MATAIASQSIIEDSLEETFAQFARPIMRDKYYDYGLWNPSIDVEAQPGSQTRIAFQFEKNGNYPEGRLKVLDEMTDRLHAQGIERVQRTDDYKLVVFIPDSAAGIGQMKKAAAESATDYAAHLLRCLVKTAASEALKEAGRGVMPPKGDLPAWRALEQEVLKRAGLSVEEAAPADEVGCKHHSFGPYSVLHIR